MSGFQTEKKLVLQLNRELDTAEPNKATDILSKYVTPDYHWRGMHPFHDQIGAKTVADLFWTPLLKSMGPLHRRPDLFFAGRNAIDNEASTWVVEMGHLMGLFDEPWIGITPSRQLTFLRYATFHRIDNGYIAETAQFCDILGLIHQTGIDPLGGQTGARILTPGPRTHDGLLYEDQPEEEGRKTFDLMKTMIEELISIKAESPRDHLAKYWNDDMCWFGPGGIGASGFFDGYRRGHTGPFEDGLEFIRHNGHLCRTSEGNFSGFFGWPSMTMRNKGNYLNVPSNDIHADMRIVDLYRREGDKLAENWIFIDILHFLNMQGVDVLADLQK